MQFSKAILIILSLILLGLVVGTSVCRATTKTPHSLDAGLAAAIGAASAMIALLPLQFRADRSPAALFQSAWIGSILHMGTAAALGIVAILVLKLSTAFAVWLLAMYWLTLAGLCIAFVKTMRDPRPAGIN